MGLIGRDVERDALRQAAALGAEGSPVHIAGVPLHKIELRKLRHAAVLAFEGNFARAAEKLHITPSALSQSIASLEDNLGLVLFDRGKSGVTLSSVGRQFIGRIDKLLFDARGLARDLALAGGAVTGDAVFGMRPTPAKIFLRELIREKIEEFPKLRLKIATTINEALVEYLLLEGFEFVICDAAYGSFDERLSSRHLASLPFEFFVRADHVLANRQDVLLEELKQFTIVSPNLTDESYASIRAWLGLSMGDEFPGAIWCDDYGYLMDAVTYSDAVLLAPSLAMAPEIEAGSIVKVEPIDVQHASACDLYLITLANRNMSPAIKLIIQKIEALLAAKMALATPVT